MNNCWLCEDVIQSLLWHLYLLTKALPHYFLSSRPQPADSTPCGHRFFVLIIIFMASGHHSDNSDTFKTSRLNKNKKNLHFLEIFKKYFSNDEFELLKFQIPPISLKLPWSCSRAQQNKDESSIGAV